MARQVISCGVFAVLCSAAALVAAQPGSSSSAPSVIDATETRLAADVVRKSLFPNEECEQAKKAGYKCATIRIAPSTFLFRGIVFEVGKAELTDPFKEQLRTFADALRDRDPSDGRVRIEGHADVTGSEQFNDLLSRQRAEAVARHLAELGVRPELFETVGHGSRKPMNPLDPTAAENRRVEIKGPE
jgi:outer membrane protein OmpA-like peptidoglycan-associated protein